MGRWSRGYRYTAPQTINIIGALVIGHGWCERWHDQDAVWWDNTYWTTSGRDRFGEGHIGENHLRKTIMLYSVTIWIYKSNPSQLADLLEHDF